MCQSWKGWVARSEPRAGESFVEVLERVLEDRNVSDTRPALRRHEALSLVPGPPDAHDAVLQIDVLGLERL
jgi:hypothetical protein